MLLRNVVRTFLIVCGLIALSACDVPGQNRPLDGTSVSLGDFRITPDMHKPVRGRAVTLPAVVNLGSEGATFVITNSIPVTSLPKNAYILYESPPAAAEFYLNGIRVGSIGSMSTNPFMPVGLHAVVPIDPNLAGSDGILDLAIKMYSLDRTISLGSLSIVDETQASRFEFYNSMNVTAYRFYGFLSIFACLFFGAQLFMRRREASNFYFTLFNFFIAAYFLGMGQIWQGLPFTLFFHIFKACLFVAIANLILFCLSYTGSVKRWQIFSIEGGGALTALLVVLIPHSIDGTVTMVGIALVPCFAVFVFVLAVMIRRMLLGAIEIRAVAIGCAVAILFASRDLVCLVQGVDPGVWMQGPGIFLLVLSVFLSIARRSSLMRETLENYMRDIGDEVNRRTHELHETNAALVKASAAKSDFLAHMSHEIRTPLNCIMGFAQIMDRRTADDADKHYAKLILRESEHLLQLINQILDLSRIEKGKLELEARPFNILDAIMTVLQGFDESARAKGLQFEFLMEDELPEYVIGDELRFQQVMINVLGNAIKFTEKGHVRLEISSRVREGNLCELRITVRDSGIGIPHEKLKSIFNSFEQADTSITRRFGGSGLGITIARDLVKLMGGEIFIDSEPDHGTRVLYTVRFPISEVVISEISAATASDADLPAFVAGVRVLVVEDYQANKDVLRVFLEQAGVAMLEAESGKQAIKILETETVDVILMDIHMPDMDGYETTGIVRNRWPYRRLPIVALTADAYPDTRAKCIESGMDEVLIKPVRYADLVRCLARVLEPSDMSSAVPHKVANRATAPGMVATRNAGDTLAVQEQLPDHRDPNAGLMDLEMLMASFFNEKDVVLQLVSGFADSGDNMMQELSAASQRHDTATVHMKAHALKGGAMNISAPTLAMAAEALERAAKKGDGPGMKAAYDVLVDEWGRFARGWREQLRGLN